MSPEAPDWASDRTALSLHAQTKGELRGCGRAASWEWLNEGLSPHAVATKGGELSGNANSLIPIAEPPMAKPQASAVVAAQSSRIARPESFSVTAPYPGLDTHPRELREPEGTHRLEDVAYAQVRRQTVKIRANF